MNDMPNKPNDDQITVTDQNQNIPVDSSDQNQPSDTPQDKPQDEAINQPADQPVKQAEMASEKQEQPKQDFGQIEVQQYDTPTKRPLASLEETLGEKPAEDLPGEPEKPEKKVVTFRPVATPPIKAPNENRGVVVATTVAIIVLAAGFAAGFAGYKLLQRQTALADTNTNATEAPKTIESNTTSNTNKNTTTNWTSYTNSKNKYSLKFPDTWYSQGTDSQTSATVQLTSFKPDISASEITDGQKVEVVFQDTNGKTLTNWISANNAATGAKVSETKKTTVDTQEASQQTFLAPVKSISTFLVYNDKIMIISYFAAVKDFDKGVAIYEDILNSIKLNS